MLGILAAAWSFAIPRLSLPHMGEPPFNVEGLSATDLHREAPAYVVLNGPSWVNALARSITPVADRVRILVP